MYQKHPVNGWSIVLFIVFVFVAFMIVAGTLTFMAAYKENRRLFLAALAVAIPLTVKSFTFEYHPTF